MILKLTTPYSPGDADKGVSYGYLHIDSFAYSSVAYSVSIIYDLGNLDAGGVYTKGLASPTVTAVTTQNELGGFATVMSPAGEPALITSQRLAYQFLIDHRGLAGTIDLSLPNDPTAPAAAVASNDVAPSSPTT